MALRYDRSESMANPDGYANKTGQCGDSLEMYIAMDRGRLRAVHFRLNGCLNTNACANAVAHLAEGKTLAQAWKITPEKIIEFLGTLPEDHYHCAELAVGAFYLALADTHRNQQKPWLKLYR